MVLMEEELKVFRRGRGYGNGHGHSNSSKVRVGQVMWTGRVR